MTLATQDVLITLDRFLEQPETKPANEYIDGSIHQKPMPQGQYSRLQLKFCNAINAVTEDKQIALAFPELRCTFGGRSIVPEAHATAFWVLYLIMSTSSVCYNA